MPAIMKNVIDKVTGIMQASPIVYPNSCGAVTGSMFKIVWIFPKIMREIELSNEIINKMIPLAVDLISEGTTLFIKIKEAAYHPSPNIYWTKNPPMEI